MMREEEISQEVQGMLCENSTQIFIQGAKLPDKTIIDRMIIIDRACEWIKENLVFYVGADGYPFYICEHDFIKDFRKAMLDMLDEEYI